jgi:carbamoyl-phosphate synthase large subunit
MVRPSYVLGGRAMEIVYDESRLTGYLASAAAVSPNRPILIDRFLEDAIEIDVDALYDGEELFIGGIMEHIEEAGIHSGDSACALPPITLGQDHIERIRHAVGAMAEALEVRGLINIQFALKDDRLFVLEANPRASRTVPFVSKATGVPLAKVAARVMVGEKLADLRAIGMLPEHDAAARPVRTHVAVKEAVMPFSRFPGVDTLLGPEMRSTGEVMGLDESFGIAYAKSQEGAYGALPTKGRVFISVRNQDKRAIVFPAWRLHDMGFEVLATAGTAEVLRRNGIPARALPKVSEGPGSVVDLLRAGEVDLIINTPQGSGPRSDGYEIRTAAVTSGTPSITTLAGAAAAIQGIDALLRGEIKVRSLQEYLAAEKASDGGER